MGEKQPQHRQAEAAPVASCQSWGYHGRAITALTAFLTSRRRLDFEISSVTEVLTPSGLSSSNRMAKVELHVDAMPPPPPRGLTGSPSVQPVSFFRLRETTGRFHTCNHLEGRMILHGRTQACSVQLARVGPCLN